MNGRQCQLHTIDRFALPPGILERATRFPKRLRRYLKRRWTYLANMIGRPGAAPGGGGGPLRGNRTGRPFEPGELVRVRTRPEIEKTLSPWNDLRGCGFMEEMWAWCGTTQRIYKPVSLFLDERHYHVRKCSGVYLLQGVECAGTKDFGPCDRSCLYFWREEWLDRIPGNGAPAGVLGIRQAGEA